MTRAQRCVVAVDGPSGSGKSTVSRRLAASLRASYLDTGAMYRAVTWAVLRSGVDAQDSDAVAKVAAETELRIGTDPGAPSIHADGVAVDVDIRGPEVTAAVSAVASVPAVRQLLVARQRELIVEAGRIVVEGRDIGTVVAPDADLKVYLTASAAERARRRSAENATDVTTTAADLARRDRLDSTRTADPLRQADDAVVLDTTELGIDEVVARLHALLDSDGALNGPDVVLDGPGVASDCDAGVAVDSGAGGVPYGGDADGARRAAP
jgi:cytidylate kinase